MDKNGYNPSIMETVPGRCYICDGAGDTVRHEIFYGNDRQTSKANGLWCYLCPECHNLAPYSIHQNPGNGYDKLLKHEAQRIYEKEHGHDAFMELIGKNYL